MSRSSALRCALVVTTLAILQPPGLAQDRHTPEPTNVSLDVTDARPMAAAITALEKRLGRVITYEDPPYLYSPQIADVTAQYSRNTASGRRILVPNGGSFHFSFAPTSAAAADDASAVLNALLDEYNQSGNPGTFRLVQTGSLFHVVPAATMDETGQSKHVSSLLDSTIAMDAEEHPALDALQKVLSAASAARGTKITVGAVPLNLFLQTRFRASSKEMIARDAVIQILQATGREWSWRLLCDPGAAGWCALNLHAVSDKSL